MAFFRSLLNCEEGWIFSFFRGNSNIRTQLWVKGPFESPSFYYIDPFKYEGQSSLETSLEKVEPTPEERTAILGMIWHWEIWEPLKTEETCTIESLVRMLDVTHDKFLEWFRRAGRDPCVLDDIVKTLDENGYVVDMAGPDGFGKFRDFRRFVTMTRKNDSSKGHAILIYENDSAVFDNSAIFKKASDILWADHYGYKIDKILRILPK